MVAPDPWALELALTRLEGVVPRELGLHLEAAARAHADDRPAPPAPASLLAAATWRAARAASRLGGDAAALALARRGRALAAPAARAYIDEDPVVAAVVRAPPSWPGLAALAAARTAAARRAGEVDFLALVHELDGSAAAEADGDSDAAVAGAAAGSGWRAPTLPAVTPARALALWRVLVAPTELAPPRLWPSASPRPSRCYPCPGGPVVVLTGIDGAAASPARWATVLHELGHAWAARTSPAVDRAGDEAVAACWSDRLAEPAVLAALAVTTPAEQAALAAEVGAQPARRRALAARLAAFERALYAGAAPPPPPALASAPPPWALWLEGGVQAAYLQAERLAARWAAGGPAEAPEHGLHALPRPATVPT